MNRLQAELHRLYRLDDGGAGDQVRAVVLALGRPAEWAALSVVWQGVQADLGLPAPAIAVSGVDGYQVWFSLAEPRPAAQALAFLESLRVRYLPGIAADRIDMMTAAPVVPALQTPTGHWSAFVAPDLAPVFADTPWLDIPPSPDGQADLLCRLHSINRADFQRALARLSPAPAKATHTEAGLVRGTRSPKSFLLEVMNDDTIELSLRIEAAKALLPYL
ncbi:hypothetical protein [Aquabacterium sp.]|uniref:hypothetical protein n=1 Tax=Aquabacterium sp. TaxID=1872578 RepID=UPI002489CBD5|nr:hypothetical protein [Aquabacterium sp.]MDI1261251.1 hypothetical protein [Aquabacterium sp.]